MNILLTGGAGYIGSHTAVELLDNGHQVVVVDNLVNSSRTSVERVEAITGKPVPFYEVDLRDAAALDAVFTAHQIDAVVHFAGLKAVGESVAQPLRYYRNNLDSTMSLCEVMDKHNVRTLVFSSSATVYGDPAELPLRETSQAGVGITNPYGQTKYMIEQILRDMVVADPRWQVTILRYFNPIGAHPSGQIGEDPNGIPNNLVPIISQVAIGRLPELQIKGDDYDTPDGTGVRDYIHVVDLAKGHYAALTHAPQPGKVATYNLGTGTGTSILQMLHAFESACGHPIANRVTERRPGDIASCYADASLAGRELEWQAKLTIDDACRDAWRWQSQNPQGYATTSSPAA